MIKEDSNKKTSKSPLQKLKDKNPEVKKLEEGMETAADALFDKSEGLRNKIGLKSSMMFLTASLVSLTVGLALGMVVCCLCGRSKCCRKKGTLKKHNPSDLLI